MMFAMTWRWLEKVILALKWWPCLLAICHIALRTLHVKGGMVMQVSPCSSHICVDVSAGNNDAADVKAAKEKGQLVPMARPNTIADGLQGRLGDLTWPIVRDLVDGVITISDRDILAAMRICFERMKVGLKALAES